VAYKKGPGQTTRAFKQMRRDGSIRGKRYDSVRDWPGSLDQQLRHKSNTSRHRKHEQNHNIFQRTCDLYTWDISSHDLLGVIVQRDGLIKNSFDKMKLHKACQVQGCRVPSSRGPQEYLKITLNISDLKLIKETFPALQTLWTDTFDPHQIAEAAKIAIILTISFDAGR
jgi:hypothetical protein